MKEEKLRLINGWVGDKKNPPYFLLFNDGLCFFTGSVYPTKNPSDPCARLSRELRPLERVTIETMENQCVVVRWTIETNGYVYMTRKHLLELM